MSASSKQKQQIFCVQQQHEKKLSSQYNNQHQQQQPTITKPIDENRLLLSKVQKWDSATTLKFLKLYYKYPCLWDMNHKHYKDRYIRQVALEKMADYMNLQNFDSRYVALKIRVLRTTYMEERRKIQRRSIETGQLTTQLDWFKFADSFLKNNIFRKSKNGTKSLTASAATRNNSSGEEILLNNNNNVNDKIVPDNNYPQINVKTEFCENDNENDNLQRNSNEIIQTSPDIYYTNNNHNIDELNVEPELNYLNHNNDDDNNDDFNGNNVVEKRRLSFNDDIYNNNVQQSTETTSPKKSKLNDNINNNEFECFGKSVTAQLKSLPLDRAYELELKIQYLLTNAKLEAFGKNASNILNMNFF